MGINIIGDSTRNAVERQGWLSRVLVEANRQGGMSWNESMSTFFYSWNYSYRHFEIDLFDHPEEIEIFTTTRNLSRPSREPAPVWGHSSGVYNLFPYSKRKDGDSTNVSGTDFAIFDTHADWNKSIFQEMYTEKFNVRTAQRISNVNPWSYDLNYCIIDTKRFTFIKSLNDLRNRATEYNLDVVGYGTRLQPVLITKFKPTSAQDRHYHYYYTCEQAPPSLSISTNSGGPGTIDVADPDTVEFTIRADEDTSSSRQTYMKDLVYKITKDGQQVVVSGQENGLPPPSNTSSLEATGKITGSAPGSFGDYKIEATARDRALNTITETFDIKLQPPAAPCTWNESTGLTDRRGVENLNFEAIACSETDGISAGVAKRIDEPKWKDYTLDDVTNLLRHVFYVFPEETKNLKYIFFYEKPEEKQPLFFGFSDLTIAKSMATPSMVSRYRLVTFGFCVRGAEQGTSDWIGESISMGDVDENCSEFPGNTGVDDTFLTGRNYDLIDKTNHLAGDSGGFFHIADAATSISDLTNEVYQLLQDYIFHTKSAYDWETEGKKYFFIVQGDAHNKIDVHAADSIKKLQAVDLSSYIGKPCYSFGYCDSRPGFSSGTASEQPPPPATLKYSDVNFSNSLTAQKTTRGIQRIINELILGNAITVTPELVPNVNWSWKTSGRIQDAMAVASGAFFNFLGHYIAPEGALRSPFGLNFGPFTNDLTKSVDNAETSSPAPLSFGGLEPKEDTNKRVVRYVASSRLNNAKARVNAAPAPVIPAGISAQARHSINSNYVNPQGKADNSIPFHTANEPVYINGTLQRFQGGIPGVSYSMDQLFKDYDVDDETQLIHCTASSSVYNRDLHEDFQKFDTYEWEGKWGDDEDRFQTGVEFKITIKANNDRGKSDAGISFSGLNERATNDTECWGKIWIGDTKDYEKTDANAKIPATFLHQQSYPYYPHVYEFYNPHFSTGRVGFGNGAKSTRTFLVRIDRKPHEEELTIFTKGYVKGNRRGELSPKSFIPKAGKIFDFAKDLYNNLPGFLFGFPFKWGFGTPFGDVGVNIPGALWEVFVLLENLLNGFFQPIVDLVNDFFNVLVTSIFGFMFALMNENYRETYHSTIEFEVEENKVYESKFEDEDVERHPATRYFGSMETPLAYLYTQYHFPFADLNRLKVYGKKYYPTLPFMQNELVTGRSLSNSRTYRKNRYFIGNVFRLTYETNIGVIYEYLARQNDVAAPSTEIDYNVKLQGRKTVVDSDKQVEKQEKCLYDIILPSDETTIASLVDENSSGLGTKSCYNGDFDSFVTDTAESAKLDSSNESKRLTMGAYSNVYSLYGNKIDPNGSSGAARIAEINKIIGEFSDIQGKLDADDGYDLSTWVSHCASGFVGLGANITPPTSNSLVGYVQNSPGSTSSTPPTYTVEAQVPTNALGTGTRAAKTITGTVKMTTPSTNPKNWEWDSSVTQAQISNSIFPAFDETTYTIVTAPGYMKDGIQYDYNTPTPGWNVNMTASPATPQNLVYKIIEFILWYVQPNGTAQATRLSASALYEFEKLMQTDINSYDPSVPEPPNAKPIIINGELYEREC